jgi:hypothetical protein
MRVHYGLQIVAVVVEGSLIVAGIPPDVNGKPERRALVEQRAKMFAVLAILYRSHPVCDGPQPDSSA